MSEKPEKRLVCRKRYVLTLLDKGAGYFASTVTACGGVTLLLISALSLWLSSRGGEGRSLHLMIGGIIALLGGLALREGRSMFRNAQKVEAVAPITRHNTGLLPAVETLVRASALPPTHQQAELLRGAMPGSETPPEDLLRVAQGGPPDA